MLKKLNKEELNRLRENLPKDAIELIAEATGLKSSSVKKILQQPERFNKAVIKLAITLAQEENKDLTEMKSIVNNLPTKL